MDRASTITAAAGEFYVGFQCSMRGFVVAVPRANVPSVDLLVSNIYGSRSISIQVKTSTGAFRLKKDSAQNRCEFDVGEKGKNVYSSNLWYAFVDLNWDESTPKVFIVPSVKVHAFFDDGVERKRYIIWLMDSDRESCLERWDLLELALKEPDAA